MAAVAAQSDGEKRVYIINVSSHHGCALHVEKGGLGRINLVALRPALESCRLPTMWSERVGGRDNNVYVAGYSCEVAFNEAVAYIAKQKKCCRNSPSTPGRCYS